MELIQCSACVITRGGYYYSSVFQYPVRASARVRVLSESRTSSLQISFRMLMKTIVFALTFAALALAAENVKVSLYIESYCPDCEHFVARDLVEFRKLPDMMAITDIDIIPYGNAHVITRDPPTFKCQHGEKECYGNYVELCAEKHFNEKWWDFLICEESSVDFSDAGVEACAKKTGVDAAVILECAKGTEGPLLHLEAADKTKDHRWVPWVIVDGTVLEDGGNFLEAVCKAYKGEKPASCKQFSSEVEKVKASLYFESYCPGCEQFITENLVHFHAKKDLMAITDLELVPYGNAHVITRDPPTFKCQHGDKECYGNYVELCAQKHFSEKWWEFIVCEETFVAFTDEGVKNCAEQAGIDAAVILECAKGTEGPLLHLEAADKTPSDHKWVPWVVVDGKVMGEEDDFEEMVCDAYKGEKPASCKKSVSEVEKVKASLYYESYCPGCESLIRSQIKDIREMKDIMAITDLELVPYGNAHVITRDPPTFECQHGEKECYGNYVELCAQKHFSDEEAWQMILCEESSTDFSDEGVQTCAKQAGIDAAVILECAKGTEGPLLHLDAADKTPKDHKWVPWVVVDGKVRDREPVLEMICNAYKGEKPASCKMLCVYSIRN